MKLFRSLVGTCVGGLVGLSIALANVDVEWDTYLGLVFVGTLVGSCVDWNDARKTPKHLATLERLHGSGRPSDGPMAVLYARVAGGAVASAVALCVIGWLLPYNDYDAPPQIVWVAAYVLFASVCGAVMGLVRGIVNYRHPSFDGTPRT